MLYTFLTPSVRAVFFCPSNPPWFVNISSFLWRIKTITLLVTRIFNHPVPSFLLGALNTNITMLLRIGKFSLENFWISVVLC
jgi:hypothetical protein